MSLEISHLDQLRCGQRESVVVGDLPFHLRLAMRCHPGVVFLRRSAIAHIDARHGDVFDRFDLLRMSLMLKTADAYFDKTRENTVVLFQYADEKAWWYRLAIRSAENGSEVWVCTYLRVRERDRLSFERKAVKIEKATPAEMQEWWEAVGGRSGLERPPGSAR